MEVLIGLILSLAAGLTIGYILAARKYHKDPIGTLRVDSSDPDGPYMFLELKTDPNLVKNDQYVTLKVDTRSYISQK